MPALPSTTHELIEWYLSKARPFLAQQAPQELAAIDQTRRRIEQLERVAGEEVAVCFLGDAGIGKSTLINALVSDEHDILPHGGIGPLTAQATIVRYAEAPYFRATYLPAERLRHILLILEGYHASTASQGAASSAADSALAQVSREVSDDDREDAEVMLSMMDGDSDADGDASTTSSAGNTDNPTSKFEAYQRRIRQLVQGNQYGDIDLPYLIDGLRRVLGLQPRFNRTLTAEDTTRVNSIRVCLRLAQGADKGSHHERRAAGDWAGFRSDLREHASGFLAPIIKELEVGWNNPGLRGGLTLVDLPGIGIANDEYREVTVDWIRNRARAVALVVTHRGVPESSARLLRTTGFLTRLLHDIDDPNADPVTLAIAVVKVDESATSHWRDEKQMQPDSARSWGAHFQQACAEVIAVVKNNMDSELGKILAEGPEDTREQRQAAIERVLETMQIHPVSALQYRIYHRHQRDEEEDRPRIKSAEESRIPAFMDALHAVAADHRRRYEERAHVAASDLAEHVRATLELVRLQWEQDLRVQKEVQELQRNLEDFLGPLQRELDARRIAFREFLRQNIPDQIHIQVTAASLRAKEDIAKYLRRLDALHWKTLCATISRGGTFDRKGRHVKLPDELTQRFEEQLVIVWSKHILAQLRQRTDELGNDNVALVGQVVEWARHQGERVQPEVVETVHKNLVAQTKSLAAIGPEAVDTLKNSVKTQLYNRLSQQIRRYCLRFVSQKKNQGRGVKKRILEFLHEELAAGVVEDARQVAEEVLRASYSSVERDISERLKKLPNPLDTVRAAIIRSSEHLSVEERRRVVADIDAILAGMPGNQA